MGMVTYSCNPNAWRGRGGLGREKFEASLSYIKISLLKKEL